MWFPIAENHLNMLNLKVWTACSNAKLFKKSAFFQCRCSIVILQTIYDRLFFIISLFMNSNSMFVLFCCLMLISIFQIKYNNPFVLSWPQLYKSSQVFCISSTQHCPFHWSSSAYLIVYLALLSCSEGDEEENKEDHWQIELIFM